MLFNPGLSSELELMDWHKEGGGLLLSSDNC